ncbi:MAG: response regulator [Thermomicrobiales bacterium]|jgi:DNA-binding NarL/FixJ family response regulator|nr:response regulator [Thermomicrobiales bacterium]
MSNSSAGTMDPPTGLLRATRDARQALREAAFAAEAAADRARSVAEVLDETLAVLVAAGSNTSPSSPVASSPTTDRLSAREREVLLLVAEGHSNKAIAEALYVSPNTVKTHVASLLNKLDADNRAQLAAIAATHGIHPPRRDRRHDYAASR